MSLTKDAAPAYNAGFTHPTDLRPGKERIVLCKDRGEKCWREGRGEDYWSERRGGVEREWVR
jgi:hypothetical protein